MSPSGDQVRVTIVVPAPPEETFRLFTEEIDRWWLRGRAFRAAGSRRGFIRMEPGVDGRLFESFENKRGEERILETGRVTVWSPPSRLIFEWRAVNFKPDESTEVEVEFAPHAEGTRVTLTHRGWAAIRPDHPARHGMDVRRFLADHGRWWAELLRSLSDLIPK